MLLIFINSLFQGFSLELWFHEHLITHPKLTHEIEYNFRLFFFLDFNNITLPHTFSTMWAFLCSHHQVLEKLHIKKTVSFSLSKSEILAKLGLLTFTLLSSITLVRCFHILIFEMCQWRLQLFKNFFKAGEIIQLKK